MALVRNLDASVARSYDSAWAVHHLASFLDLLLRTTASLLFRLCPSTSPNRHRRLNARTRAFSRCNFSYRFSWLHPPRAKQHHAPDPIALLRKRSRARGYYAFPTRRIAKRSLAIRVDVLAQQAFEYLVRVGNVTIADRHHKQRRGHAALVQGAEVYVVGVDNAKEGSPATACTVGIAAERLRDRRRRDMLVGMEGKHLGQRDPHLPPVRHEGGLGEAMPDSFLQGRSCLYTLPFNYSQQESQPTSRP